MTFIAARRFNRHIILVSDTKISDPSGTLRRSTDNVHANNYVPGRLKAFPMNLRISVAYAGRSGKALNILRSIWRKTTDISCDLDYLVETLRIGSNDGDVDFIIISHISDAEIYKIANGKVFSGQEFQWIGDGSVAPLFSSSIEQTKIRRETAILNGWGMNLPAGYQVDGEEDFRSAWVNLLLTAPMLTNSVGGIPIVILGSPIGHCFVNSAGAYNPASFTITANGTFDSDGRPVNPLDLQYSYSLVGSALRGAPVLGLWLQEAHSAYLYDPMTHDAARAIHPSTMQNLSSEIENRSKFLGGLMVD